MKINKDLVDAVMMVSFIVLVLVGTTTFEDEVKKHVIMGVLAVVTVSMVALRFFFFFKGEEKKDAF